MILFLKLCLFVDVCLFHVDYCTYLYQSVYEAIKVLFSCLHEFLKLLIHILKLEKF